MKTNSKAGSPVGSGRAGRNSRAVSGRRKVKTNLKNDTGIHKTQTDRQKLESSLWRKESGNGFEE